MNIIQTDTLILGGGLAGLRCAIGIKRRGKDVIVLSLVPPKRSHSAAAQGGMQASLGNCSKGFGDNEDVHFFDTVRGGDWGADQKVVRMFVNTAPKAVRELAAWGVPWNRVHKGEHQSVIDGKNVKISEEDDAHGLITARNFGGTEKWRTCYVADGTGHSMLYSVSNQAIANNIPVHERMEAMSLIHDGHRCYGAVVRNLMTGELVVYVAKSTCIATGGFGRIYRNTTNAVINEGMGTAIALETGVATLGNMEAMQFHPTAIFPAGILVTEGCRGDGGLLLDVKNHRFMPDYEPEKKELASRDVVSRWMENHILKGNGVENRFGKHLWLDIRLLGRKHIENQLREVNEICRYFLGIDPAKDLIPVRPAQHYSMGGIRTDYTGQSPNLVGLFAVGEAACWDIHGFNRLGGNSVAETVVGGMIVGEYISNYLDSECSEMKISTALLRDSLSLQRKTLSSFNGTENPFHIMRSMQNIMSEKVGIFRNKDRLNQAIDELQTLNRKATKIRVSSNSRGNNPELITAYRVKRMLKLALCVAYGALQRKESRGAHFREDYPLRDDKNWLCRTLASWESDHQELPTLSYEELDIQQMEMPPGWRGYGEKEHIKHNDSAKRQEKVEKIKSENKNNGGDRFTTQNQIMPYTNMLPQSLQEKNERYKEGISSE